MSTKDKYIKRLEKDIEALQLDIEALQLDLEGASERICPNLNLVASYTSIYHHIKKPYCLLMSRNTELIEDNLRLKSDSIEARNNLKKLEKRKKGKNKK